MRNKTSCFGLLDLLAEVSQKDYWLMGELICPVRNPNRVKRNILSGDIGQIDVCQIWFTKFRN